MAYNSTNNNYDDMSNNPYHEGEHGSSTSSAAPRPAAASSGNTSSSNWFCHACQADFVLTDEQVARATGSPACPSCGGEFVEQVAESADDPHDFDRVPQNPFAFFGGGGQQQHTPGGGNGSAQPGGPLGIDGGPFAALLQQFFNGGMAMPNQSHQPQNQHRQAEGANTHHFQHDQQDPQRSSSTPPDPARAAAQAAERRAAGLSPVPASTSQDQQPGRPTSSSGVYRSGGTTFIWNTANSSNRPPPSRPLNERMQSDPSGGSSGNEQDRVPVRNLASFLSEAFQGPPQQTRQHQEADQQAQSYLQEGPARRGNDRPGGQGFEGDPLSAFLAQLAGGMGVPLGAQREENPTGEAGAGQDNAAPGQGQGGRRGNARIFMTNPNGGGGIMTFTFGTGGHGEGGQQGGGMAPFPFMPFMMGGGGGQGGNPGQMGDYVFSQGALDNIITELMNQANGRYGPQPAPEEVINNLPKVTMSKELLANDSIQDCAVCKDNFEENDEALTLPCHHLFHTDCIKPWLERSGTCPVCRYQLVEQPEPPRGPGEAGNPASGQVQGSGPGPTSPISPSTARSPPIEGGSTMPGGYGGFPFGRIFSTIGNLITGGSNSGSGEGSTSSGQQRAASAGQAEENQPDRGSTNANQQDRPDMEDLDLD